jgi:PQQ-dependent catabolism-associated CXXCW motif protein
MYIPKTVSFRLWGVLLVACALAIAGHATAAEEGAVTEPTGYKMDDYRSPVPKTLSGAKVVTADEAEEIWKAKSAVFVDVFPKAPKPPNLPAGTVWRDPTHMSIDGATWLPNVGHGASTPEQDEYFKSRLETLTGGDKARPIIIFCQRNCWMSWNAAKRALAMGYSNVTWFPDGSDGWQDIGNELVYLKSLP